jgi:hypothetical protein
MPNKLAKLKAQDMENFPEQLQDVFHFLSISTNYSLIGSSSWKNTMYNNDFDLNELYESKDTNHILDRIYEMFKQKFQTAMKDPDFYLIDFKCGEDNKKEPIRWTYDDIIKGKVGKYTFQQCLLVNATMKLDLIYMFNGLATEVTENYFLKIGNKANFTKIMLNKDENRKTLVESYNECVHDKMYFKALKRLFSIQALEKKPSQKLLDLFNSELGLLYKCICSLGCVVLLLEQTFKEVPTKSIIDNIQIIKYNASKIVDIGVNVTKDLDKICTLKSKSAMVKQIEQVCKNLNIILNKHASKYLIKIDKK